MIKPFPSDRIGRDIMKKRKVFIDWRKVWRDVGYCGRSDCQSLCVHEKGMVRRAVEKVIRAKYEKAEG